MLHFGETIRVCPLFTTPEQRERYHQDQPSLPPHKGDGGQGLSESMEISLSPFVQWGEGKAFGPNNNELTRQACQ
jgi:hypothetical protein